MIAIVPYRSEWPAEFDTLGRRLRECLGDLALCIDHIGSTAVPGLAAKDIIDVQITARQLAPEFEDAIRQSGYQRSEHTQDHPPPGKDPRPREWEKRLFKPPAASRPVNVHVRLPGRANQRYAILFRDYLRANPTVAQAYAR